MKKRLILSTLAIAGITAVALASCGKSGVDIYGADNSGKVMKMGNSEITFKEKSEIPYISVKDGVELMSYVRAINLDDKKYNYSFKEEGSNFVITNDRGAKCILNPENQTLYFDDYDLFVSMIPSNQEALSMVPIKKNFKALKVTSQTYTKGQPVTIDLKKYTKLDIYVKDNKCYLPLSVFNSALLSASENVDLAYNGKNLFFVSADVLTTQTVLGKIPSDLGDKLREGAEKQSISQEFSEYYYQSLCFDFDYQYGLKEKFTSFDSFLQSNYKNEILSTNPKQIDAYTLYALSYLNDGHTTLNDYSIMYPFGENDFDFSKCSKTKVDWEKDDDAFSKKKKAANIPNGLDYKGDTVFVTFAQFTSLNEDYLYPTKSDSSDSDDDIGIPGLDFGIFDDDSDKYESTEYIFHSLYKDLTTDQTKKNQVKNIVVDLTTNGGGAADALIYSLSTLIGNVTFDMTNPLSKGHNHQTYLADINADGQINSEDKSLSELGFNIYFLNSRYSFSSANAMPYLAKLNKPNAVMLGDKTAGGPCAIKYIVTPIGNAYVSSSLSVISKPKDGGYVNIDDGIPADFKLTEEQMINRNCIVESINNWKLDN